MTSKQFCKLLEYIVHEPIPYTYRAYSGEHVCVGIESELGVFRLAVQLVCASMILHNTDAYDMELMGTLSGLSPGEDRSGPNTIIYFPEFPWKE